MFFNIKSADAARNPMLHSRVNIRNDVSLLDKRSKQLTHFICPLRDCRTAWGRA
jgi:hypothetical protein